VATAKRQPKYDETVRGTRVRVYATRSEYEVLIGDGDVADPDAEVWCYPKVGTPGTWAAQAIAEHPDLFEPIKPRPPEPIHAFNVRITCVRATTTALPGRHVTSITLVPGQPVPPWSLPAGYPKIFRVEIEAITIALA